MQSLRTRAPAPVRAENGFSIVEVLIAAALLLVVTIGVLPMFTRAMVNNVQGAEATEVTNRAKSRVEELYQLPFNGEPLDLANPPAWATTTDTAVTMTEWFLDSTQDWVTTEPTSEGDIRYIRETRLRQFNIAALENDGEFDDSEALARTAPTSSVHLKEIRVRVRTPDSLGALGPGREVELLVYKPF